MASMIRIAKRGNILVAGYKTSTHHTKLRDRVKQMELVTPQEQLPTSPPVVDHEMMKKRPIITHGINGSPHEMKNGPIVTHISGSPDHVFSSRVEGDFIHLVLRQRGSPKLTKLFVMQLPRTSATVMVDNEKFHVNVEEHDDVKDTWKLLDKEKVTAMTQYLNFRYQIEMMSKIKEPARKLLEEHGPGLMKIAGDNFGRALLIKFGIPPCVVGFIGDSVMYCTNIIFGKKGETTTITTTTTTPRLYTEDEVKKMIEEESQMMHTLHQFEAYKVRGDDFEFDTSLKVNVFGLGKEDLVVWVSKEYVLVSSTNRVEAPEKTVEQVIRLPENLDYNPDEVTGTIMEDGRLKITFPGPKEEDGKHKAKYFKVKLV